MKALLNEKLIINLKTKVFVKNKILNNLSIYLSNFKNKRTLVIIDKFLHDNLSKRNYIQKNISFIKNKIYFVNSFYEPTFFDLENIINLSGKKKFDLIIGIGGGSTIDIAKGLSVAITYNKNIRNLQGKDKFFHDPIPVVAIPSIFGSGAEITPSAVFINEKTKVKGGINSDKVQPQYAFLDPYLARSNDLKQHVICAFDALVHSLESYESKLSNDFTKSFALNGSVKVLSGLKLLNSNKILGLNLIAEGSIYSIISLMHSEQSITGATSYPLATYFGYNHAFCGASFLDKSLKFFWKKDKKYLSKVILTMYEEGLINNNTMKSLIDELLSIKNINKIKNIILEKKQNEFLANKIIKMPMIKYSPFKFKRKDIMEFLNNE